ncbi:MAG TPA: hypothetical protein VFV88_02840 [Steroidobacteraceae bacterium]|nr:hypothetical protein [Steroidobacteraceae bacterium]
MRLNASLACALVSGMLSAIVPAAPPTSPETRAEVISRIDALEKKPYDPAARDARGTVMTWLIDAPDVSVTICSALLGDLDELDQDGGELFATQLPFSEARFILENPSKADDEFAVHVAGVEGMLRTYANMKATRPDLRIRHLEKLLKAQAAGKLDAFVKDAMEKCH